MKTFKPQTNFYNLFWIFLFGSILGFVVEGVYAIYRTGHWEHHGSTIWGPFCIVYGIGAVVVYVLSSYLENKNFFIQFIGFVMAGCIVEYTSSIIQEIIFGSISWNYDQHTMNLKGRISMRTGIMWGSLGSAFIYLLYPTIKKHIIKFFGSSIKKITLFLVIFMALNITLSAMCVLRWRERIQGEPPSNIIEQYLDEKYDNEKMEELFINLEFS